MNTDLCFNIIAQMLVEVMFNRPTAARSLCDQLDAALKEYEDAEVS